MAVIQPNDNTHIAIGLIQFHSTSYWTEMRAKCLSSQTFCAPLRFDPRHVSGGGGGADMLCTPPHPESTSATGLLWGKKNNNKKKTAHIQTVTLDMHRQQRFVE